MAVFIAMLKPGDTVMGMNLDHGGHLTHGSPVNFSGLYFNIVPYGAVSYTHLDVYKRQDSEAVMEYAHINRPHYIVNCA